MYLVHHVRNSMGRPVCTVVAVDREHIGVAVCHPNELSKKKLAVEVATGRALCGTMPKTLNKERWEFVRCTSNEGHHYYDCQPISEIVENAVLRMKERALRYFKETK